MPNVQSIGLTSTPRVGTRAQLDAAFGAIAPTGPTISELQEQGLLPKPSLGLYQQQLGRALRRRFVHAQRARTLRRAGKIVRFHHNSETGRAVYVWVPMVTGIVLDHVA